MPMPRWWGQINKRLFNPRALVNGKWDVVTHVGRSSGRVYRTPLAATEVDGTFLFILVYGPESDWVQNILARGEATLATGDEVVELFNPRLISAEVARPLVQGRVKLPPGFLNVDRFLQMDVLTRDRLAQPRP